MKKSILSVLIFFASICLYAAPSQSLYLLKNKIESHILNELSTYTEDEIKVQADKLDPRLNLKACAENKLEIFNPHQTPMLNTNTMAIKCLEDDNHWTLFVPIKISVLNCIRCKKVKN